ncbi:hypothetical protein LX36DRAFT_139376 [Colletotrichum falcatum]|nr:hypothetical protein LX36DRAFT_139376 [Colletotrichum falcatum]
MSGAHSRDDYGVCQAQTSRGRYKTGRRGAGDVMLLYLYNRYHVFYPVSLARGTPVISSQEIGWLLASQASAVLGGSGPDLDGQRPTFGWRAFHVTPKETVGSCGARKICIAVIERREGGIEPEEEGKEDGKQTPQQKVRGEKSSQSCRERSPGHGRSVRMDCGVLAKVFPHPEPGGVHEKWQGTTLFPPPRQ